MNWNVAQKLILLSGFILSSFSFLNQIFRRLYIQRFNFSDFNPLTVNDVYKSQTKIMARRRCDL